MTKIIAEIGQNAMGDYDLAKKMVDECLPYADIIKFQYWNVPSIYHEDDVRYRPAIERNLSYEEITKLLVYIENNGKTPCVSFFGATEEEKNGFFASKNLIIKYASSEINEIDKDIRNNKLLQEKYDNKKIIASLGYAGRLETIDNKIIWLGCVPEYPTTYPYNALNQMTTLKNNGLQAGYSDHVEGIHVCKTAIMLNADYIEKHYTTKGMREVNEFRDHRLSMVKQELIELKEFRDDHLQILNDPHFINKDENGKRRVKK